MFIGPLLVRIHSVQSKLAHVHFSLINPKASCLAFTYPGCCGDYGDSFLSIQFSARTAIS